MTDLPIASLPPAAAAPAKAAAGSGLHAGPAGAGLLPQGVNATQALSPFQQALALELGPGGCGLPGPALPAAEGPHCAPEAPTEDAPQAACADAAAAQLTLAGMFALPSELFARAAPAAAASVPVADPRQLPDAGAAIGPAGAQAEPAEAAAAVFAASDIFAPAAERTAAGVQASPPPKALAEELAAGGKFASAAQSTVVHAAAPGERDITAAVAAPSLSMPSHAALPESSAQAPVAQLDVRVGERGWDQDLGGKLVWMAGHKQQVAELHLNPPELGPLKITLTIHEDQASAQFVSAHATVREALEASLPRLREMLADSGITLGQASVGAETFRQQAQQEGRAHPAVAIAAAPAETGATQRGERALGMARGLVDTFA